MAASVPPRVAYEEHVGELRVSIEAATLEDVFAEAARVVGRECGPVEGEPGPWLDVALAARDDATLLVEWMNELIGLAEIAGRALDDVRFDELGSGRLRARVRGRPVASWASPVKAATYHDLHLDPVANGWRAEVLLDV